MNSIHAWTDLHLDLDPDSDSDRRGSEISDGKMTKCIGRHMYAGIYTPLGVHASRSKHGRVIIMRGEAVGFLTEK